MHAGFVPRYAGARGRFIQSDGDAEPILRKACMQSGLTQALAEYCCWRLGSRRQASIFVVSTCIVSTKFVDSLAASTWAKRAKAGDAKLPT